MKKLMIASAAVALAGLTFAETATEARVYDVKAIAMTTVAQKNAVAKEYNPFLSADASELVYREITTKTYSGLIWGCDCDGIAAYTELEKFPVLDLNNRVLYYTNHWEGAVVWDDVPVANKYRTVWVGPAATNGYDSAGKGIWKFINVVEALGNKVEGCWEINPFTVACDGSVTTNLLMGSGFGYLRGYEDNSANTRTSCYTATPDYMTGYFAGYVGAPIYTWGENRTICLYCTGKIERLQCMAAQVWDFCRCIPFMDATKTACFGQWTITVNAELSNAIMAEVDALDAFPLTQEIKDEVLAVRKQIDSSRW